MTEQTPAGNEVGRFIGLVLIVIGVLWMAASGLCSAGFAVALFAEGGGNASDALSVLSVVLLYGGLSALLGFGVFAIGRVLRPSAK
jgi:hypothetical protein